MMLTHNLFNLYPHYLSPEWNQGGPYTTILHPSDELNFRKWVINNNIPFRPSPLNDYDMRGFYKALMMNDPLAVRSNANGHFPDTWKTPFHATFSNESKYATSDAPHWEDNKLVSKDGKILHEEK